VATTGTTQEEFTLDTAAELAADEGGGSKIQGKSPWALAGRRLRRNYTALAFLGVFIFMLFICFAGAPLYGHYISHQGWDDENASGSIVENGKKIALISQSHTTISPDGTVHLVPGGIPLGPQWGKSGGQYFFGSDGLGRDVGTRLLYGGRNTLTIGIGASVITTVVAILLALVAAYFGGASDWIISRLFDLIWAFPVILLGISLGTALNINGFHHTIIPSFWIFPGLTINIAAGSLWIPVAVIAFVFIPYIGRPLRGQVLALRNREFVEASTAQGAGPLRIMFSELLPNIASSVLVLFTLIVANAILTEVALSFLGAGVQPPQPSWGTMIADGQLIVASDPWLAILPGIMITITVISLNVFGDGLRDALDPRAKVRIER
jgi:peptide/nickel transport system permease protein